MLRSAGNECKLTGGGCRGERGGLIHMHAVGAVVVLQLIHILAEVSPNLVRGQVGEKPCQRLPAGALARLQALLHLRVGPTKLGEVLAREPCNGQRDVVTSARAWHSARLVVRVAMSSGGPKVLDVAEHTRRVLLAQQELVDVAGDEGGLPGLLLASEGAAVGAVGGDDIEDRLPD